MTIFAMCVVLRRNCARPVSRSQDAGTPESCGGGDFTGGRVCLKLLGAALTRIGMGRVCGSVKLFLALQRVCSVCLHQRFVWFTSLSSDSYCSTRASRHASFSPIVGAHKAAWNCRSFAMAVTVRS